MQKCVHLQEISRCLLFKMDEKAVRTTLPGFIFLTRLLKEPSRSKVVCFTGMASTILSEQSYKDRKENFNDKKVTIITPAADLINNEKRCIRYETNVYSPMADSELGTEFLSPTFSRTRFKTNIIGTMYFKSNEMEQCYTSFIIWVKCRNRPRY